MPTNPVNRGPLLYIKNDINYKLRPDFNINKDKELESIFIEIFFLASSIGTPPLHASKGI